MTHTDEQVDELLRRWAAEKRAQAPALRPAMRSSRAARGRRRWVVAALGAAAAIAAVFAAVTLSDHHNPAGGSRHHFGLNPGCGDDASLEAIGSSAIEQVSAAAGGPFMVTGRLRVNHFSVRAVTQ